MLTARESPPISRRLARTSIARWLRLVLRWLGLVSGARLALYATYWGLTWELRERGARPGIGLVATPIVRGTLRETVAANGKVEPLARVIVQSEISRERELAAAFATRGKYDTQRLRGSLDA